MALLLGSSAWRRAASAGDVGEGVVGDSETPAFVWGDVELSPKDEFGNQEAMQQMLFQRFYFSGDVDTDWGHVASDLRMLKGVATARLPAIALGVANGLYHFFFFREGQDTPEMRTDTMLDALQLFNTSLWFANCFDPRTELQSFLIGLCGMKFGFVQLLAAELGAAYAAAHDIVAAGSVLSWASQVFRVMSSLPYFALGGFRWTRPLDMAFNHELYPNAFGPVWPKENVPLARYLESKFDDFRADLDAILASPGLFDRLRELERNAEGLSVWPPGSRKHIELADLREDEPWKAQLCQFANTTCELLRQRPEVSECPRAAVMIARLSPGAWLKPHYGNSRRLVAHLGLIVPDGPITLNVGSARGLRWTQGQAMVFDDTHVHDARHTGDTGDRYILHVMFCHPCEQRQLYPHLSAGDCEFDNPIREEVSRALRGEMDAREAQARSAKRMVIPRNAPQDI